MSVLTINAFPSNSYVTVVYNSETTVGMVPFTMEIETGSTIQYKVEALQCTPDPDPSKGSEYKTLLVDEDKTLSVILNYIGAVQPDTWVPALGNETFPTHIAMLGKGGWRSVESNDERDAIPSARREAGMSVYVTSTNKVYILDDDLVTWNELESGKVDDVRLHNVSVVDSKIANLETVRQVTTLPVEPLIAGEIVQYIGNTNANYTNGYFYKQTNRNTTYSNLQFTPLGDYEIDVEVSIEDFTTLVNEVVFNKTNYPITHGRFGYRQATPEVSWYFDGNSGHQYDGFTYNNTPEGFAELGFTVTPPIGPQQGLDYTVENTTTWIWERVDVQPNPTVYESFFRGKYGDWTLVPTDPSAYLEDFHGNTTPLKNDYMVVTDASGYVNPDFSDDPENVAIHNIIRAGDPTVSITVGTTTITIPYTNVQSLKTIREIFTSQGYTDIGCEWLQLRYQSSAPGYWVVKGNSDYYINNESTPGTTEHRLFYTSEPATNMFYLSKNAGVAPIALFGGWRFRYISEWASKGKNGWKPEYQIENVLPIADSQTLGIAKLYTTTGTHTDGSVTQKLVTDELGKKQDTLTEGTGISIDENNVISATFSESYFRGKFSTWNTVPTDYRNYYPDYTGSTKPTRTDYMVVEDPSGYVKPGAPIQIYNEPKPTSIAYARIVFGATDITLAHDQVGANPDGVVIGTVGNQLRVKYVTPTWSITPLDVPVIVDGVEKPVGQVAFSWSYGSGQTEVLVKELNFAGTGGYEGTWRFSYQSDNWDATGKNGWEPEYQIEDVLPIATDTDAGIMKLYTTTGSNTDGTMDQSSITIELETLDTNKQDLLTNASNAGEGIIIDDVTQEISTNNIVWRKW